MSHFHERFDIGMDLDTARERFINRAMNEIINTLPGEHPTLDYFDVTRQVVSALGELYRIQTCLDEYVEGDFLGVLRAIEAFWTGAPHMRGRLDKVVLNILEQSELDLGVRWDNGKFLPTGAELLDRAVVDDPLHWLRQSGHDTVVQPFEKALRHFLEAPKRTDLHSDVVTDAYEALEALAKIVTSKNRDLSANREAFISKLGFEDFHKKLLREYVTYGCKFRHAEGGVAPRPDPSRAEAEFFLYLTGLFIRLAMESS